MFWGEDLPLLLRPGSLVSLFSLRKDGRWQYNSNIEVLEHPSVCMND